MSDLVKRAGVYKKFRCDYFFPTIVNVKKKHLCRYIFTALLCFKKQFVTAEEM